MCLWFVIVHKFVAHCVYDTSLADSAVKLVCTTVTFIVVLNVFTTFLITYYAGQVKRTRKVPAIFTFVKGLKSTLEDAKPASKPLT